MTFKAIETIIIFSSQNQVGLKNRAKAQPTPYNRWLVSKFGNNTTCPIIHFQNNLHYYQFCKLCTTSREPPYYVVGHQSIIYENFLCWIFSNCYRKLFQDPKASWCPYLENFKLAPFSSGPHIPPFIHHRHNNSLN